MSKQTAVKWLKEKLPSLFVDDNNGFYSKLFNHALEMEREQIIDAYYYDPNCDEIKDDGELYYKETFGEKFGEKFGGQDE